MRAWGRVYNADGSYNWVAVNTDLNTGDNTEVYLTQLVQVLKMSINESPFYADWGIPAQRSVIQQIAPNYYVALTQQRFAPYFASLIITQTATIPPTYKIACITNQGVSLSLSVPN